MFSSSLINDHRLRNRDLRGYPLSTYYSSTQKNTIIISFITSPARTLLTTKYDLGENRTHDASFASDYSTIPTEPKGNDTQQ